MAWFVRHAQYIGDSAIFLQPGITDRLVMQTAVDNPPTARKCVSFPESRIRVAVFCNMTRLRLRTAESVLWLFYPLAMSLLELTHIPLNLPKIVI